MADLIFDGGFSTQLSTSGHEIDDDPLWSSRLLNTNPEAIYDVHKRYLEAGADAIISSSYQASLQGFKEHLECTDERARELMLFSARLVKQARDDFWKEFSSLKTKDFEGRKRPLTCASLGPYGACLADGSEYTGSYIGTVSEEELISWHDQRLSILAEEELDLYLFETIPALEEAVAATKLMEKYPNLNFAVSFSCKNGEQLCHGETFKEAVQFLDSSRVVAVGINCSSPNFISVFMNSPNGHSSISVVRSNRSPLGVVRCVIEKTALGGIQKSLLKSIQGVTSKKVLVMPNCGAEWTSEKSWSFTAKVNLSENVKEWKELGADWIGGCCEIGPKQITKIRETLTESGVRDHT